MIQTFRTIRRKLREIRRHSATRRRTPLAVIHDTVFVATFFAAIPTALMVEQFVERHVSTSFVSGRLYEASEGTMLVVIEGRAGTPERQHPWGEFTISLDEHRRGWPITSAIWRPPARIFINPYARASARTYDASSSDPVVQAVVARTLTAGQIEPAVTDALRTGRSTSHRSWFKSVFSVLTWWVLLNFLGTFFGYAAYLVIHMVRVKRGVAAETRAARGLCPKCGYDMQGLEFIARCPECGTFVY